MSMCAYARPQCSVSNAPARDQVTVVFVLLWTEHPVKSLQDVSPRPRSLVRFHNMLGRPGLFSLGVLNDGVYLFMTFKSQSKS